MTPPVTIAVVSWNTRELLRACLESTVPVIESGLAAVWVVDNASDDRSAEMVEESFPQVELLALDENAGFGRAVNEVAGRSAGEWIAAANADVRLEPGALEALLGAGRADPGVGAVAPRLVMPDGTVQHSVHPFPSVAVAVAFNLRLHRAIPRLGDRLCIEGHWDPERARAVSWAHGAFLLLRRKAFERIGGFDRDQWLYAEDVDIQWRLRTDGWTVRYEPGAAVHHEVAAATSAAFGDARTARHVAATYAWLARRRGMALTWFWAGANALGAGVRAAALAVAALVAPRRFGFPREHAALFARLHARGLRRRAALIEAAPRPVHSGPDGRPRSRA